MKAQRAAIYARYPSEMQDARSIEDQVRLCQDYMRRHDLRPAEVYSDAALSGASVHGRKGLERLMQDARRGVIDVVVTEDLDRLSRNQADIAGFYERMSFLGIEIWTVADGRVSELHVGLKGTMSALFLRNLALKTHRGLQGRVRAGKSAGGRCYGYRVAGTGEREIHSEEAGIVNRIFLAFLRGDSARDIAAALNREEVPGPRGGAWNASTINGSKSRGNGVLRNELYAGRIVWNRQRFVKDPDTGKRISRANDVGERQITDVPHLRIVPEETWTLVQQRLAARPESGGPLRKPRHLLSGLCKCGTCGGSFIVAAPNKLGCSRRRETGLCDNRRMISLKMLEGRILTAMEQHLLHPDVLARVAQAHLEERRRLRQEADRQQHATRRRLGEIEREIARIVDIMATTDLADPTALVQRMNALTAEAAELKERNSAAAEVVEFHPAIVSRYTAIVRNLRAELNSQAEENRAQVIEAARSLIQRVVIYANDDARGRDLELEGTLAALMGTEESVRDGMGRMVAGAGFEPAAFRL